MPRARSPNRDKAKKLYLDSKGKMKLKDIATELELKDSQIRKWKSQDKWDNELKGALPKRKSNVTNKKKNKSVIKKEPTEQEVEALIENSELTDKQRLFCISYIKCFNATKAAIKAGYSKGTAGVIGYQLLQKTLIQDEIKKLKASKLNRAMLSEDDIFQRYIDIAFADITDYIEFGQEDVAIEDGVKVAVNYVRLNESSDVDGSVISEVSKGKDGAKIKLLDKMKALDFLAKHIGLLSQQNKQRMELENEKIKKLRAEITKDDDKDKPIEIIIKRKGEE